MMISDSLKKELETQHQALLEDLQKNGFNYTQIPSDLHGETKQGEAFSIAYPIQGLLKYHGMVNSAEKIAYFPSISLNNQAGVTVSYLKLDLRLEQDFFMINGERLLMDNPKAQRISHQLKYLRKYSQIGTKCIYLSRNVDSLTLEPLTGKGLGTSASGGAALATAFMDIVYKNQPNLNENSQLKSLYSRFLAGSASRSAVGGIGLWLNHPSISSFDSLSLRLDRTKDQDFINNIDLITVAIPSEITTNTIHEYAPDSLFYEAWLQKRYSVLKKFLSALQKHEFSTLGELVEYDTLCLHGVSMTGKVDSTDILWDPATIKIMKLIQDLRKNNITAYFSIDTGPSVVILTLTQYTDSVIRSLKELNLQFPIITGKIGGESQTIVRNHPLAKFISKDFQHIVVN